MPTRKMRQFLTLSVSLTSSALSLQQLPQRTSQVCVTSAQGDLTEVAQSIASDLNLPYFSTDDTSVGLDYSHVLDVVPFRGDTYALGIRPVGSSKRKGRLTRSSGTPSPHIVDFCPPKDSRLAQRSKRAGSDMLVKAVGPRKVEGGASILDLTAGFGQDSLLLHQNGASQVCMVERDPIVATLLQDAMRRRRAALDNNDHDTASLSLKVGNSVDIVRSLTSQEYPDVCYVDPMFPPRTKSAAVKKNMQILHSLLGSQDDTNETQHDEITLLEAALDVAQVRVVVKRPVNAGPLGGQDGPKPSYDLRGSSNRWDVYITT